MLSLEEVHDLQIITGVLIPKRHGLVYNVIASNFLGHSGIAAGKQRMDVIVYGASTIA